MAEQNKSHVVIGVTIMFEVIALSAIVLRFWSLRIKRRQWALHDVLIIIAFVCVTGLAICLLLSATIGGLGTHGAELVSTPWKLVNFGKLLIALQVCWAGAMTATRLSILSLYVHVFIERNTFRMYCYTMMAVTMLWCIGELLTVFLICRPLAYNWDSSIDATCGNTIGGYLSVHIFNFVIDLTIALLPAPVLWKLHMPQGKKFGLTIIFALGALVCAIAIVRVGLYRDVSDYTDIDFTYTGATLYLFTAIDSSLGVTLACMPLLRPVGERLVTSSAVTWIRSMTGTSPNRSSNASSTRLGYRETYSLEAKQLYPKTDVSGGGLCMQGSTSDSGILVRCQFEQRTEQNYDCEMVTMGK
ncbi:hypothetical protein VPNG_03453 [Cytospora leucostoma]|uniref:Rhodopsin domain-containing protein n=1 Tax=Cytospora leucostoma TaxID=1230097 RepID=A0A423XFU0_9PEZI|nr:hypothetical protein VPNG_03453 [Cytospora leucostoma]